MKTNKTLISSAIATVLATSAAYAAPSFEERDISNVGWSVDFIQRSYDAESNTTTFSYSLTAGATEKDLSHWVLGYDGEDSIPVFATGCSTQSFGLDPTTGVYGLKCDDGQAASTTAEYSVTVPGDVCAAETEYTVKGGTYFAVGSTTGPGAACVTEKPSTYSLSGTVYLDADLDGSLGADEPLFPNVTVILYDFEHNEVLRTMSDENGDYRFDNLVPGDYIVKIPTATELISGDFNEQLAGYFDGNVTDNSLSIALNADSVNNDFGFAVDTVAILDDLNPADSDADGYTMTGTGKTIGFWKHQNSVAIKGKGRAQVDAVTLQGYLDEIETSWLVGVDKPFEFNDVNEYQDAFDIMKNTSSDEVDLLAKQLLGTELNHVSGRGLADEALQSALIGWAEYIVSYPVSFTREEILAAKDICDYINNTGE